MADIEKIIDKFQKLDKNIIFLEETALLSKNEILNDYQKTLAIEHSLQISLQVVIDVSKDILKENDIQNYADLIERLKNKKIISEELSMTFKKMIGLRNILIYEYDSIDFEIIYNILKNELNRFHEFETSIREYLDK